MGEPEKTIDCFFQGQFAAAVVIVPARYTGPFGKKTCATVFGVEENLHPTKGTVHVDCSYKETLKDTDFKMAYSCKCVKYYHFLGMVLVTETDKTGKIYVETLTRFCCCPHVFPISLSDSYSSSHNFGRKWHTGRKK